MLAFLDCCRVERDSVWERRRKRTELGSILPNGYDALSVAPVGGFSVVDVVAAMMQMRCWWSNISREERKVDPCRIRRNQGKNQLEGKEIDGGEMVARC